MDYSTLSDETLIELLARSQPHALGELYDRYSRLVFSLALKMVGDQATAEEITLDDMCPPSPKCGQKRPE